MTPAGFIALFIGATLLWVGWNNWRHRDSEAIPWVEDKLLSIDQQPLPRGKFDRTSRRIQAILGFIFGLFFLLCGAAVLLPSGD